MKLPALIGNGGGVTKLLNKPFIHFNWKFIFTNLVKIRISLDKA